MFNTFKRDYVSRAGRHVHVRNYINEICHANQCSQRNFEIWVVGVHLGQMENFVYPHIK